jgi:hypothetical protein
MRVLRTHYINATEQRGIGEDSIPLEDSIIDSRGDLYRFGVREYGRCTGKVYEDTDAGTVECGYVFEGRDRYEDTGETYLREVWLILEDVGEPAPTPREPVALSAL